MSILTKIIGGWFHRGGVVKDGRDRLLRPGEILVPLSKAKALKVVPGELKRTITVPTTIWYGDEEGPEA